MSGLEGNSKIIWAYVFILQLRKRDPEVEKALPDLTDLVSREAGTKLPVTWLPAQCPPLSPGFPSSEGCAPLLLYWHKKFPCYEIPCHLQEGEPAANLF